MKKFFSLLLIPLTILIGAVLLVAFLIKTKPETKQSQPSKIIPRVEVLQVKTATHTPWIESFGTVRSYYETDLSSLSGGEVIKVSPRFQAGESVSKGEVLLEVNTADYVANLAKQKAAVATAKQNLLSEEAHARIAKNNWLSSGRTLEKATPYTLRTPHVEAAKSLLESAKAALVQAELDLTRTKVVAPYDAIIQTRSVSPGEVINSGAGFGAGTSLGRIIARNKAEVRLPLTPGEVKQLKLPLAFRHPQNPRIKATDANEINKTHEALDVHLSSPAYPGSHWIGKITRTEVSIDPTNQVVFVVAEIDHPFDTPGTAPLPIGTFVKTRIQGKVLKNTLELPESAIIDDQYIWVTDKESKLYRQPIKRLYSSKGMVIARLPKDTTANTFQVCTRPLPSFHKGQKTHPQILQPAPQPTTQITNPPHDRKPTDSKSVLQTPQLPNSKAPTR